MKILNNYNILLIFTLILNFYLISCNGYQAERNYDFSKVDSIVIGSSNYSLSPEFQRDSKTVLTKDSITNIVEDSEFVIEFISYPVSESDFIEILELMQNSKIENCIRKGEPCDGAWSLYLECYNSGNEVLTGYIELCNTEIGNLCGDLEAVREGIFKLLPKNNVTE